MRVAFCVVFGLLVACGGDEAAQGGKRKDGGAESGAFTDDYPKGGCSDAAKLVYVLTDLDGLYSFDPTKLAFKYIGTLNCKDAYKPNSMAVDRSGYAWVNYQDGALFKVNTSDAGCESTSFAPEAGFTRFGMAFSSDQAGGKEETLFVASLDGGGVGTIDLKTFKLTRIGDFSGDFQRRRAELTGTGDGKLYAFITTSPATLAEVNKTNGATSNERPLTDVHAGTDWAFSFWGGDFWFYTNEKSAIETTSRVTQYRLSTTRQLTVVKKSIGFSIVGAGVSTCAPVEPPK
jgi:hypothetical protein